MIKKAEEEGKMTGLKVARNAPAVSHLLFADDSMFYCKTKDEELDQLMSLLDKYSLASGQRINYQKSSIYFGKRIPVAERNSIKNKLGIAQEGGGGKYLGLPESFGGVKVSILSYIKDSLAQRIDGWQNKFLSQGGKEVLLKAVALALPTYTMACFQLPKTLCEKITALMADLWWTNQKEKKGIHWKAWEHMSMPKRHGDIGFKDLEAFNLALFGKQLWRMITRKDTLLSRVFRARYFHNSDPLEVKLGSRPSYAWKSIHAAQSLIKMGARRIIENGAETDIWKDKWINKLPATPIQATRRPMPQVTHLISSLVKVKHLLDPDGRNWNRELLELIFTENDINSIEEFRPGGVRTQDNYT